MQSSIMLDEVNDKKRFDELTHLISVRLQAKDFPELAERLLHLIFISLEFSQFSYNSNLPSMINGSSPA